MTSLRLELLQRCGIKADGSDMGMYRSEQDRLDEVTPLSNGARIPTAEIETYRTISAALPNRPSELFGSDPTPRHSIRFRFRSCNDPLAVSPG